MLVQTRGFHRAELERFRELQRRCFSIQAEVAAGLREGVTERQVAGDLFRRYRAAGAGNFFHLPVALFGERTGLPGAWKVGDFYPRDVPLRAGDPVILDGAPLFDGFLVDTSTSLSFGENAEHARMMRGLLAQRAKILDAVRKGRSFREIADAVAVEGAALGYEGVHEKHPGRVLGHRALRVRGPAGWRLRGSDGATLGWFLWKIAQSRWWPRQSPLWNREATSDHPPTDGLWLVEPHFANGRFGAKWEEILVVEAGRAEWLEAEPPHVARWA